MGEVEGEIGSPTLATKVRSKSRSYVDKQEPLSLSAPAFLYQSNIDQYLQEKLKIDPSYQIKNWREIVVLRDVYADFHFGQVLGVGTFGLIREAIYIP